MNLAEELLLCTIDDKGNIASSHRIAAAIGGALLAELTLETRIRIQGGSLRVTDPTPTGDPLADELLTALGDANTTQLPAQTLVPTFGVSAFPRVQEGTVAAGAVQMEEGKRNLIGLRKPETRRLTPVGEELRSRVRAALLSETAPDERTAAVAALVAACGFHKVLVPREQRGAAERRGKELAEGQDVPDVVADAIRSAQTAVASLMS